MTTPLLEIAGLGVRAGATSILEDVTFSVARGAIHCLAGPNGAGKSTLLRAVLGQIHFTGSIKLHFTGAGQVGLVPQSFAIDRSVPLTVLEFLALSRSSRPVCFGPPRAVRDTARALLARVGLEALADRQLSALSGGELQRVLLVNALDPTPEILILDEPTSSLDRAAADQIETLLQAARTDHDVTVLMVSHDLAQMQRLADRVTILNRSVVTDAPPDEALSSLRAILPLVGAA